MINYIFWSIISILLIVKYVHTLQARKTFTRTIGFNWVAWYSKEKIIETHSNRFRSFLQVNNRITFGIWAAVAFWLMALMFAWAGLL